MNCPVRVWLVVLALAPPWVQAATWSQLMESARGAQERAELGVALEHLEAARVRARAFGTNDPRHAQVLNDLGVLQLRAQNLTEAVTLLEEAVRLRRPGTGAEHKLALASSQNNLAVAYQALGRYREADALYRKALSARDRLLGPGAPETAETLNNIATLFRLQGRARAAEPLLRRALATREETFGPHHPIVAEAANNLALLLQDLGDLAGAQALGERAVGIYEAMPVAEDPRLATALNNLAAIGLEQARRSRNAQQVDRLVARSEALYRRSLQIRVSALGAENLYTADSLNNLGDFYRIAGSSATPSGAFRAAERFYRRALDVYERVLGSEHPTLAAGYHNLASLYLAAGRARDALELARKATQVHRARILRGGLDDSVGARTERGRMRVMFENHIHALVAAQGSAASRRDGALGEGFELAQLAGNLSAAQALSQTAARFATGGGQLAKLVRDRQDLSRAVRIREAEMLATAALPAAARDRARETRYRSALQSARADLGKADSQLARRYPRYRALVNPSPMTTGEVQRLLKSGEVMLVYTIGSGGAGVWTITPSRARFQSLDTRANELRQAVARLRIAVDPPAGIESLADVPAFNVALAHELYKKLVEPVLADIRDAHSLILVPDGPLFSLPFSVLVGTRPDRRRRPVGDYLDIDWLIKKHALSVLPSVSSLRALREVAGASRASKSLLGIGNPVLQPGNGTLRRGALDLGNLLARGATVSAADLRRLPGLPDSETELRAIARGMGVAKAEILLGATASEGRIKSMDLTRYRTVAFATHALVAGDFEGLSEPGLILTPPRTGSSRDDGYLAVSEIAALKLDAQWVVLSACNTAAEDGTPSGGALSGFARAFFYAGSRSLLVSHWPVGSVAASQLTTGMFGALSADGKLARARALRESMLSLMRDRSAPHFAHPLFWAPFMVVGEGV